MADSRFFPLVPGIEIPGDWYTGAVPANVQAGEGTVIDSASCFQRYKAEGGYGLRVGVGTTISRTALAAEASGRIEIGDYCYLSDASLACVDRISIGNDVLIANGVTIVDSDFHPFSVADRIVDAEALSPVGDESQRPSFPATPVVIEDGVRIGFNATILKGVHIGRDAVVAPGAVVSRDVAPGAFVSGNPAEEVKRDG